MPNSYGNNTSVSNGKALDNPFKSLGAALSKADKLKAGNFKFSAKSAMNFLLKGVTIRTNYLYAGSVEIAYFDASLAPFVAYKVQSSQPYTAGYKPPLVSWQNTFIQPYAAAVTVYMDITQYFYDQWQYNNPNPWVQPIRISLTEADVLGGGGHITNPSKWDYGNLNFSI